MLLTCDSCKLPLLVLGAAMWMSGCASHTQEINYWDPGDTYQQYETDLAGREVSIFLGDGTTAVGRELRIDTETTSWRDVGTDTRTSVPTTEVWKLEAVERGQGAGRGLAMGVLIGAGAGALLGVATNTDDSTLDDGSAALLGAATLGVVGGLVGLIAGAATDETTTYEVNPGLVPTRDPEPAPQDSG